MASDYLNNLIAKARANLSGLEIVIDEVAVNRVGIAFYDPEGHRIVMRWEDLTGDRLSPALIHELRHAFYESQIRKGRDVEWYGTLEFYSEGRKFNDIYTDVLSPEETVTYALDMYLAFRQENFSYDEFIKAYGVVESNLNWLQTVSKLSLERLREGTLDRLDIRTERKKKLTSVDLYADDYIVRTLFQAQPVDARTSKGRKYWQGRMESRLRFWHDRAAALIPIFERIKQALREGRSSDTFKHVKEFRHEARKTPSQ